MNEKRKAKVGNLIRCIRVNYDYNDIKIGDLCIVTREKSQDGRKEVISRQQIVTIEKLSDSFTTDIWESSLNHRAQEDPEFEFVD